MTVMSVEMLNGQQGQLPVVNRGVGDNGPDGGPDGSYLSPWRQEVLPPDQPGVFGTQRQIPTDGEIHIAQDAAGYRMYPKLITPDHDARQFPYTGDVPFSESLLPVESYRTRAEAFKQIPYWDVKPVMGPDDWPSRKLFPAEPNMRTVDTIEHNPMPLPYTKNDHGGYSVMDIPMDFNPDADGFLAGLGSFGADDSSDYGPVMAKATDVATNAVVQTVAANPQAAAQPGVLDSLVAAAAKIAGAVVTQTIAKPPTTTTATAPKPPTVVVPTPPSAPIYTSPGFLALAALGLVGVGYMVLKK